SNGPFRSNNTPLNFNQWTSQLTDPGSLWTQVNYPAPERNIETYSQEVLGLSANIPAFMLEAKKQSRFNWRAEYTTEAITQYIRAGYID
ncbi:MAG: hypothetical protein AAF202_13675, partial [Pseudomonadota bacterium]